MTPARYPRTELADPQGHLLEEIARPGVTREDMALSYALALRTADRVEWPRVNHAIIDRWSLTGLCWIKARAWKLTADGAR